MMKIALKLTLVGMLLISMVRGGGNVLAQLDDRFGAKGVEGTIHLGQKGLNWFRDWEDSYLPDNYPSPGKNKIWTVGKIGYRTDGLGMDYRWIILDLLEDTDVDLLQNFFNLCVAIVDSNIIPIIGDYWEENRPLLEKQLEDTLNNFTYTDKKLGIKYRARGKNTDISFQEALPKFNLTVAGDTILVTTSISADWKTHIYIEAWVLNPNPFNWGYFWKDVGDADGKFTTSISITGYVTLDGLGRDRHLQVKEIVADSKTESNIDWSVFGIGFQWENLSNEIENLVDGELEKALRNELNKEPITDPYYFVDFFKSLFSGGNVPTQQDILDRIWEGEKNYIKEVIKENGYEGQYWSIGYEPNWYPMLSPVQYADFYTRYYRLIKQLDPGANVLGPSIFLTEAVNNFEEVAWLFIPDIFKGLLISIKEDFQNLIYSYFSLADSKTWYREFIDHLPDDVKVDVNDFHIFPVSADFQAIDWDSLTYCIDEMAIFMHQVSQVDEVWVSEFGNNDGKRSEAEVAELCRHLSQYFKTNTVGIDRWFWFLSRGYSPFYDIPFTPKPPVTALLKNNFTLSQIGKAYLFEADNTAPVMTSVPTDEGKSTRAGKIIFRWKDAVEYDTGIQDYQLEVKVEPGNATFFNNWIGNRLVYIINFYEGKTLFARVRAKNGAGLVGNWSGWSDGITVIAADSSDIIITGADHSEKKSGQESSSDLAADAENSAEIAIEIFQSGRENVTTNLKSASHEKPGSFKLFQNYPNPFNSSTSINYQLAEAAHVMVKIYNARGKEIRVLVDEFRTAGHYTVPWDGKDNAGHSVASGVFFYRMQAGVFASVEKMVILR